MRILLDTFLMSVFLLLGYLVKDLLTLFIIWAIIIALFMVDEYLVGDTIEYD